MKQYIVRLEYKTLPDSALDKNISLNGSIGPLQTYQEAFNILQNKCYCDEWIHSACIEKVEPH
jgi:hypothetical protein